MLNNNQKQRYSLISASGEVYATGYILGFTYDNKAIIQLEHTFTGPCSNLGIVTIPFGRLRTLPTQEEAQAMGSNKESNEIVEVIEYWQTICSKKEQWPESLAVLTEVTR